MVHYLKLIALTVALTLFSVPAWGQTQACNDREIIIQLLRTGEFAELLAYRGLTNSGSMMEVTVNEETGTWTLFISSADKVSCLIAVGQAWRKVITPPSLGPPA